MIVHNLYVENFRSIRAASLNCELLTALVGRNGVGKSGFLNAIDLFYSTSEQLSEEDFYNRDTSNDIIIEITFCDLSDEASKMFADRLDMDFLAVRKRIKWENGRIKVTYHGTVLQCPDFKSIREGLNLRDRGKTAKEALVELRKDQRYESLPEWSTIDNVRRALIEWEKTHPEQCERVEDDGQFFGFKQVAEGYLGRFTRRIFIPAVREAKSDADEGRGSVFSELMDLVVRDALGRRPEILELSQMMLEKYTEVLEEDDQSELVNLAGDLSTSLETFVPSAGVQITWTPIDSMELPTPRANVQLVEEGYSSPVDRCGHGLQRAFILTMLHKLSLARMSGTYDSHEATIEESGSRDHLPRLILLFEEPELYQHPNRQRHFARILMNLIGEEVSESSIFNQVIYSTHSPHFVGLDRIENIRLLDRVEVEPGFPKETLVFQTSLDKVASRIWEANQGNGPKFTGSTLKPRLVSIMTPWMSEGFFADTVVLVEGDDDRAAIIGMANVMGVDFEGQGISVIPCGGKNNLDRPVTIFQELGIRVYAIWDSDSEEGGANLACNRALQRLFKVTEIEDWPSMVASEFACFERNLEYALKQDVGEHLYEKLLARYQDEFGIPKKKHAIKNPFVVGALIEEAEKNGKSCEVLREIVDSILAMNQSRISER